MTGLSGVLASLQSHGESWRASVPDSWLQGRTAYGGLSTALALQTAKLAHPDLPPLRSALVAFVGPLAGEIRLSVTLLRRGRNAAFVRVDVAGEAGLGLTATFVFMRALGSSVDHVAATAPAVASPKPGDPISRGLPQVAFTQHFEMLDCHDTSLGPADWLRWVRLAERNGLDPEVELVAVADCLPPGALRLVGGHAPVSSMTWQLNLLAQPTTNDGWFLMRTTSDFTRAGTSSQNMAIWSASGVPVAQQMQSVALFV
jgi:acyl-CoA thioesterase